MGRLRLRQLLCSILFGVAFATPVASQDKFHDVYNRGLEFMEKADWPRAIEEFKAAISMEFEDRASKQTYGTKFIEYFPHRELGIAYFQLGDHRLALEELQISIATAPSKRANEFIEKSYKAMARTTTMSSLSYGKTDSMSSEDLHPRAYVALFLRDDRGEIPLTDHRLTEYIRPESSIRLAFPEALLKAAISPISLDSLSNKIRLLSSYLRFLVTQQNEALAEAGAEDSARIAGKYRKDLEEAMVETQYLKRMTRRLSIKVFANVVLPGGFTFPLEVPNYFSYGDSSLPAERVYAITSDGQLHDEIVDTDINLADHHLPHGTRVELNIESRSGGNTWTYTKYFVISADRWKYEFRPAMAFVKRLVNEKQNGQTPKKSDFKPAPAGVVQLTYSPNKPESLEKMVQTFSVGVMVLLADYDPGQNVEVGLGLGAAVFNSSIGVGLGWNIQAATHPGFFYVSADVLRLIEALQRGY